MNKVFEIKSLCVPIKKAVKKTENEFFDGVKDLFLGTTREINPKYLGVKSKNKLKITPILKKGYVYVINARGTDLYKIGVSDNLNRRFRDISGNSPLPVFICLCAEMDNPNNLEDYLHNKYKDRYFKNDWFNLDSKDFKELASIFNYCYANK